MKVSELARKAGLKSSTVRYYLEIGLIEPTQRTHSGYYLFNDIALERIRTIRDLRQKRRNISEIREYFRTVEGEL